jgi:hypothetical protein
VLTITKAESPERDMPEVGRLIWPVRLVWVCACRHLWAAHTHYRKGADCACGNCPRWRRRRLRFVRGA